MQSKPSLAFSEARMLLNACLDAAGARSVSISVAIADEAGNLLHFGRMDGARSHTIELASQKARLAATVGVPTAAIEAMYRQRGVAAPSGFPGSGGLPIVFEGQCAGAIGVSGAAPEMDEAIARDATIRLAAPG